MRGLTEALNIEWKRHDIRVCDIWPPLVKTAMTDGVDFLLSAQNDDGSWGDATGVGYLVSPVPGAFRTYRSACSALALASFASIGLRFRA